MISTEGFEGTISGSFFYFKNRGGLMKCFECGIDGAPYEYDDMHLCWECFEPYWYIDKEQKEKQEQEKIDKFLNEIDL
jgi:hypothetical protein